MNRIFQPDEVVWAKIINARRVQDAVEYTVGFFGDTTHSILGEDKVAEFQSNYTEFEAKGRPHRKHVKSLLLAEEYLKNRGLNLELTKKPNKRNSGKFAKPGNSSVVGGSQGPTSERPRDNNSMIMDDEGDDNEEMASEPPCPSSISVKAGAQIPQRSLSEAESLHQQKLKQISPEPQPLIKQAQQQQSILSAGLGNENKLVINNSNNNGNSVEISPSRKLSSFQSPKRSAFNATTAIKQQLAESKKKSQQQQLVMESVQKAGRVQAQNKLIEPVVVIEVQSTALQRKRSFTKAQQPKVVASLTDAIDNLASGEPAFKKQAKSAMPRFQPAPKHNPKNTTTTTISIGKMQIQSNSISPAKDAFVHHNPSVHNQTKFSTTATTAIMSKQKDTQPSTAAVAKNNLGPKERHDKEARHIKEVIESFSGMPRKLLHYLESATINTHNIRVYLDNGVVEILKQIQDPKAQSMIEQLKRIIIEKYFQDSDRGRANRTKIGYGITSSKKEQDKTSSTKKEQLEGAAKKSQDQAAGIKKDQEPLSIKPKHKHKQIQLQSKTNNTTAGKEEDELSAKDDKPEEIRKKTVRKIKKCLDTYNIDESKKESNKDAAREIQELILSKDKAMGHRYRQYMTEAIKLLANRLSVSVVKELIKYDDILNFKAHKPAKEI